MPKSLLAVAIVLLTAAGAFAADDDPQLCAGFAPPYRNTCKFPIMVYSKTETGPLRTYQLVPGQASPDERSPAERSGQVRTVVCHAGEKAFEWHGGAHESAPWAGGSDSYECRKN